MELWRKRCQMFFQTIKNQNQIINSLSDETNNVVNSLLQNEELIENLRRECVLARELRTGIQDEEDKLKKNNSTISNPMMPLEKHDVTWKMEMDEKLNLAMKESLTLRKQLQNEHGQHLTQIKFLSQTTDSLKNQVEKTKTISEQNNLLFSLIEEFDNSSDSTDKDIDNSLKVIKQLRDKNDQANSRLNIVLCENKRLQSENELLKCQLRESQLLLEAHQRRRDNSLMTVDKHTKILNHVQSLKILLEDNKRLLQKYDQFETEAATLGPYSLEKDTSNSNTTVDKEKTLLKNQVSSLQTEIAQWKNKVKDVNTKNKKISEELRNTSNQLDEHIVSENKLQCRISTLKEEKMKAEAERDRFIREMMTLKKLSTSEDDLRSQNSELIAKSREECTENSSEDLRPAFGDEKRPETPKRVSSLSDITIKSPRIQPENIGAASSSTPNSIECEVVSCNTPALINSPSALSTLIYNNSLSDSSPFEGFAEKAIDDSVLKLVIDEKDERQLIAHRNYCLGDRILIEEPLIMGPVAEPRSPICIGCGVIVSDELLCCDCGWPVCHLKCDKFDLHKSYECNIFKKCPDINFQKLSSTGGLYHQYDCVLPLRLLLLSERNTEMWSCIEKMESFVDERRNTSLWKKEKDHVVNHIRQKCNLKSHLKTHFARRVLLTFEYSGHLNKCEDVNSFVLKTKYNVRCLFKTSHRISHSCIPNTSCVISPKMDFKLFVNAAVNISKGEKLKHSRTRVNLPTLSRRQDLLHTSYIRCTCERCSDPTELNTNFSSLRCRKCRKGLVKPQNPLDFETDWKCDQCSYVMMYTTLNKLYTKVQNELNDIENATNVKECSEKSEKLLGTYENVFHFNHAFIVFMKCCSLIEFQQNIVRSTDLNVINRNIIRLYEVLDVFNIISPGSTSLRANTLHWLRKAYFAKIKFFDQNEDYADELRNQNVSKVFEILRVLDKFGDIAKAQNQTFKSPVVIQKTLSNSKKKVRKRKNSSNPEMKFYNVHQTKVRRSTRSKPKRNCALLEPERVDEKEKTETLPKYQDQYFEYQIFSAEEHNSFVIEEQGSDVIVEEDDVQKIMEFDGANNLQQSEKENHDEDEVNFCSELEENIIRLFDTDDNVVAVEE